MCIRDRLYSASKYAIGSFTDGLRMELKRDGIHAMTVCPGYVNTRFQSNILAGSVPEQIARSRRFAITAEECAGDIVRGVVREARTVMTPRTGWLLVAAARLAPWLVDAQLDDLQISALGITFDPLDVPRDQFIVAGEAWQMCRRGEANPADFGIMDMHGWWFIWGNVVRELLAFNKVEILPWDYEVGFFTHGLADPLPAEGPELAEYDRMAALSIAGDQAFLALRNLYACEPQLHVPAAWFR